MAQTACSFWKVLFKYSKSQRFKCYSSQICLFIPTSVHAEGPGGRGAVYESADDHFWCLPHQDFGQEELAT